jgi:hypothetical protein
MTINPLEKLDMWLLEERSRRNPFAHGAVLGTQETSSIENSAETILYLDIDRV